MTDTPMKTILCNGANPGRLINKSNKANVLTLNYLRNGSTEPNINLDLPRFVVRVLHLPDRLLDLLEIAAYIFSADRLVSRGPHDAVEYHSWSRSFHFVVRIRDYAFWKNPAVGKSLANALEFATGDRSYKFTFQPGHSTPATGLFDKKECVVKPGRDYSVMLFSGGMDSLAGALELLEQTKERVCLVSHQPQPGTKKTQNALVDALKRYYPNRIAHYCFNLTLRGIRAVEETQRSRSFLYGSIAFAIARALSQERFIIYENGITSINFPRREDLANARASRTTHPRTVYLLQRFLQLLDQKPIQIKTPFLWKTKTDVFHTIERLNHPELISSTVSCSKTFQKLELSTHCGICFQCFDRRLAAYASECESYDGAGIYYCDVINEEIESAESRTTLVDYIRQAKNFATWNENHFYSQMLGHLAELAGCVPGHDDDNELAEGVGGLCHRHGEQISLALRRMRNQDDPFRTLVHGSLLQLVFSEREHLNTPIKRLINSIADRVSTAVPLMFRVKRPEHEPDFNAKVGAMIAADAPSFRSEHPTVSFACAKVVPDHLFTDANLLIESKYIRKGTSPSKASDGIAADLMKYPPKAHILFFVYDPDRAIQNDSTFKRDFESRGRCTILILR